MMPRRGAVAGLLASLMVVTGAGLAWACTAQTLMQVAPSMTGPAGSQVQVTASVASAGPVSLRWNGAQGPVLASGEARPRESVDMSVTIPEVPPGVYYLVLVADGNDVARAAYEVTGRAPGAAGRTVWERSGGAGLDPGTGGQLADPYSSARAGMIVLTVGIAALGGLTLAGLHRRRVPAARRIDRRP